MSPTRQYSIVMLKIHNASQPVFIRSDHERHVVDACNDRLTILTSPLMPRLDKISLLPSTYHGSRNPSPKALTLRSPPGVTILTLYDVGSCHRPERLTTLGIPVLSTTRASTSVFMKIPRPPPRHSHDVHYPTFQPRLTTTLVMQRQVQIAAETPAYDTRSRLAARAHPPVSSRVHLRDLTAS